MLKIDKLTIGIRTADTMFRVISEWGSLVDAVLAIRNEKPLRDPEYFTTIISNAERDGVQLDGPKSGNSLRITRADIVFVQDRYSGVLSLDRFFQEFETIFATVDKTLKLSAVRRIGIVAEHRIRDIKKPSVYLIDRLTKLPVPDFAAKFSWQVEKRLPSGELVEPDVQKSDFRNVIHQFYDSELDTSVPAKNAINTNLDVQRYYTPARTSAIIAACHELRKEFETEWSTFEKQLAVLKVTSP